jgi:hypothetical protein
VRPLGRNGWYMKLFGLKQNPSRVWLAHEMAAFEVEDLRWLEGYLATVTRQLRRMASAMPLSFSAYGGGIAGVPIYMLGLNLKIFARLTAFAFAHAASRARYTAKGYPINYLAIVRRLP